MASEQKAKDCVGCGGYYKPKADVNCCGGCRRVPVTAKRAAPVLDMLKLQAWWEKKQAELLADKLRSAVSIFAELRGDRGTAHVQSAGHGKLYR